MIVFIRCDDRLIHGQCQTKIIPLNKITRVIGVDDATATNPMLKRIFEMAAPQGVKVTVHTFDDALTPIRKCMINEKRTLIITLLEDKVSQSEGTARGKQMMSLAKAYYLDDQPQKAIQTLTQARRLLQGTPLVYAVEAALKDLSLLSNEKEAME